MLLYGINVQPEDLTSTSHKSYVANRCQGCRLSLSQKK